MSKPLECKVCGRQVVMVTEVVEIRELQEEDVGRFPGDIETDRNYWLRDLDCFVECRSYPHHACGYEVLWDDTAEDVTIQSTEVS